MSDEDKKPEEDLTDAMRVVEDLTRDIEQDEKGDGQPGGKTRRVRVLKKGASENQDAPSEVDPLMSAPDDDDASQDTRSLTELLDVVEESFEQENEQENDGLPGKGEAASPDQQKMTDLTEVPQILQDLLWVDKHDDKDEDKGSQPIVTDVALSEDGLDLPSEIRLEDDINVMVATDGEAEEPKAGPEALPDDGGQSLTELLKEVDREVVEADKSRPEEPYADQARQGFDGEPSGGMFAGIMSRVFGLHGMEREGPDTAPSSPESDPMASGQARTPGKGGSYDYEALPGKSGAPVAVNSAPAEDSADQQSDDLSGFYDRPFDPDLTDVVQCEQAQITPLQRYSLYLGSQITEFPKDKFQVAAAEKSNREFVEGLEEGRAALGRINILIRYGEALQEEIQGNPGQAIALLQQLDEPDINHPMPRQDLARLAEAADDAPRAIAEYRALLDLTDNVEVQKFSLTRLVALNYRARHLDQIVPLVQKLCDLANEQESHAVLTRLITFPEKVENVDDRLWLVNALLALPVFRQDPTLLSLAHDLAVGRNDDQGQVAYLGRLARATSGEDSVKWITLWLEKLYALEGHTDGSDPLAEPSDLLIGRLSTLERPDLVAQSSRVLMKGMPDHLDTLTRLENFADSNGQPRLCTLVLTHRYNLLEDAAARFDLMGRLVLLYEDLGDDAQAEHWFEKQVGMADDPVEIIRQRVRRISGEKKIVWLESLIDHARQRADVDTQIDGYRQLEDVADANHDDDLKLTALKGLVALGHQPIAHLRQILTISKSRNDLSLAQPTLVSLLDLVEAPQERIPLLKDLITTSGSLNDQDQMAKCLEELLPLLETAMEYLEEKLGEFKGVKRVFWLDQQITYIESHGGMLLKLRRALEERLSHSVEVDSRIRMLKKLVDVGANPEAWTVKLLNLLRAEGLRDQLLERLDLLLVDPANDPVQSALLDERIKYYQQDGQTVEAGALLKRLCQSAPDRVDALVQLIDDHPETLDDNEWFEFGAMLTRGIAQREADQIGSLVQALSKVVDALSRSHRSDQAVVLLVRAPDAIFDPSTGFSLAGSFGALFDKINPLTLGGMTPADVDRLLELCPDIPSVQQAAFILRLKAFCKEGDFEQVLTLMDPSDPLWTEKISLVAKLEDATVMALITLLRQSHEAIPVLLALSENTASLKVRLLTIQVLAMLYEQDKNYPAAKDCLETVLITASTQNSTREDLLPLWSRLFRVAQLDSDKTLQDSMAPDIISLDLRYDTSHGRLILPALEHQVRREIGSGNTLEAKSLLERVLAIRQALGSEPTLIERLLINLGDLCLKVKDYDASIANYQRAFDLHRRHEIPDRETRQHNLRLRLRTVESQRELAKVKRIKS